MEQREQREMRKAVLIAEQDSVLTVLEPVAAGEVVCAGSQQVTAVEAIPQYHKIARWQLPMGVSIYKYGQPMGYATADIQAGQWVHTHNAASRPEKEESV